MFTTLEPLDNSKHQELRLSKDQFFNFAKSISSVQISFSEMLPASQYYPIIFPADGSCIPTVLFSLKEGENRYIDELGNWKAPYVPLALRLYPFTMVKIKEEEGKYAMCLDRDAEHFSSGQGEPMFTADGEKNEFIQGILSALTTYQQELINTQTIFTELAEQELIVDRTVNYKINGEDKSIDGFKGFDMEKLVTMDDETIANLVKKGAMPLIYSHMQSLSRIPNLA